MAQRVVCRSPASTCRLSSVATFSGKNVASLGRTATTRPQLSARHRSVRVAAVLDVTEDTFDAEVLKV